MTQKRILVSYFIVSGCFVEVWPSDEPLRVKVNKFKRIQNWDHQLISKANIKAQVEVLGDLEISEEVTETYRDFRSIEKGFWKQERTRA